MWLTGHYFFFVIFKKETMADTDKHEVEVSTLKTGQLKFGIDQINNPAPEKWKRISSACRYFFVSLITMVSGTDLFVGNQSKIICFVLGILVLVSGAFDVFLGVEPPSSQKNNS